MGKSSKPTIGFHYRVAYHHGLTIGPIDAFLEFRGGDKTAWRGELTASGTISVNAPNLWGGEKDQGGIVGDLDVMFGEPTQAVNAYLVSTFGDQTSAWRGFTTVVFKGGRYGAMNPYPQKASYKFRQILQGWDGGACWYPEKAEIAIGEEVPYSEAGTFKVLAGSEIRNTEATFYGTFASDFIGTAEQIAQICMDQRNLVEGGSFVLLKAACGLIVDNTGYVNSTAVSHGIHVGIAGVPVILLCGSGFSATVTGSGTSAVGILDPVVSCSIDFGPKGINPAHVLYYSRTNGDMGREPTANINEASLTAGADKLYAEVFGICPKWNPAAESVEDFEQRICRLIGGSFSRSLEDGQWHLDLARGDYVLEDLPILTDDDILDFKEQPSTLDSAINSVSVRYFDPEKKETIVTPPVRAMGLVAAFGTIHQTYDYPEIPTAALAVRVALMLLLTTATPTRAFDLATTRRTYAWRPNQYFRLQSVKRGIADMVCLVGEKQSGTLKSGAIKMKATQDIYSLPTTSFVEVEPGVDTRPPQVPTPILLQRAIEAPYVEVAATLTRADLAVLPVDVGYAMAVAAAPAGELDYTMMVEPDGGSYEDMGIGQWCATATVVEAATLEGTAPTDFTLAGGVRLDQIEVGMAVLWDDEIGRVDAIDVGAATISLGRGCADTAPAEHVAGSRLWFYPTGFSRDVTEYTDGETVDIKLLANTGSQQLSLASATPMSLTFDQRQARPYPPGKLLFSGTLLTDAPYPAVLVGSLTTKWAHRDRVLQADQLVDTEDASVGPEAGTTYTVTYEQPPGSVVNTQSAISGTTATPYAFPADGLARISVTAHRDGLASWQAIAHTFDYLLSPPEFLLLESGDFLLLESGDKLKLE